MPKLSIACDESQSLVLKHLFSSFPFSRHIIYKIGILSICQQHDDKYDDSLHDGD